MLIQETCSEDQEDGWDLHLHQLIFFVLVASPLVDSFSCLRLVASSIFVRDTETMNLGMRGGKLMSDPLAASPLTDGFVPSPFLLFAVSAFARNSMIMNLGMCCGKLLTDSLPLVVVVPSQAY